MKQVEPALTDRQWARHLATPRHADGVAIAGAARSVARAFAARQHGRPARHRTAALALHGQPFGFTWEDVDVLREMADYLANVSDFPQAVDNERAKMLSLADRIAALLPPREDDR